MRTAISLVFLVLSACGQPVADAAQSGLAVECSPSPSTYVIDPELVSYAESAARCVALGGALAEFDSTAELQAVFDAWVTAQYVDGTVPPSEGLWVGTWITSVEGDEWGFAMVRGGALLPVEQDDPEQLAVSACEITSSLP